MLLIALLQRTPLSAELYGAVMSGAIAFAVFGAYCPHRLPRAFAGSLGMSISGFGAAAAYAIIGLGVQLGGLIGLVVAVVGFVLDEFCSEWFWCVFKHFEPGRYRRPTARPQRLPTVRLTTLSYRLVLGLAER